MKKIKNIKEINADIVLLDSEDKQIIEEIVKYEEEIFHEGAIGIWNIKPFIKYGKVYVLSSIEGEKELVSVIEIIKDFKKPKVYIYGFFTKEKFRNKGYGNIFLKSIIKELHDTHGINEIELTVSPENKRAISLYEKNGFQKEILLKDEYGEGENRYLMAKKL